MSSTNELTASQRGWLEQANRTEHAGWIHLAVKGTPFERGFQPETPSMPGRIRDDA